MRDKREPRISTRPKKAGRKSWNDAVQNPGAHKSPVTESTRATEIALGDVTEGRIEQTGPLGREFTYVDIGSIDRDTKRIVDPKRLASSKAPSRARQVLKAGDVLVSMTRPNLNAVAVVPRDLDGSIGSTGFHVLRARQADAHFLYYAVQSPAFVDALCRKVQGALYPAVRPRDISSFRIFSFSLEQQRHVVAEIEKQFTRLEAGVVALRRVQDNLTRYRAAVLKAAYAGRLVPSEAKLASARKGESQFETGDGLLTRILAGRQPISKDRQRSNDAVVIGDTDRTLPKGWTWTTIGACFRVAVGATPSRKVAAYWGGDIPWVSSGEVCFRAIVDTRETITLAGLAHSSTQLNPKGSVLVGMIGEGKTRGQTAILKIDACNNQNCAAIWVTHTDVPPEYVYYWLWSQYDNTRRQSSGNNQPALNKARVEAMPLPLPPLAEQARIVLEIERRLSVVDELEAMVTANLGRAARLRQSILQRAFSGDLLPPESIERSAAMTCRPAANT